MVRLSQGAQFYAFVPGLRPDSCAGQQNAAFVTLPDRRPLAELVRRQETPRSCNNRWLRLIDGRNVLAKLPERNQLFGRERPRCYILLLEIVFLPLGISRANCHMQNVDRLM